MIRKGREKAISLTTAGTSPRIKGQTGAVKTVFFAAGPDADAMRKYREPRKIRQFLDLAVMKERKYKITCNNIQ